MEKWYMKVQAELLKKLPSRKRFFWGEDAECVYFTPDDSNAVLICVPKTFFYLDAEKLKNKALPVLPATIQSIIKTESDFVPATKTGNVFSGKDVYLTLKNTDWSTFVNVKHLKHFSSTAEFETSGEITAVRVYDYSAYNLRQFVGIVLPARVKKDDNNQA